MPKTEQVFQLCHRDHDSRSKKAAPKGGFFRKIMDAELDHLLDIPELFSQVMPGKRHASSVSA